MQKLVLLAAVGAAVVSRGLIPWIDRRLEQVSSARMKCCLPGAGVAIDSGK